MKHPPYHLRINKAVDRLLLVDVLRALGPEYEQFTYHSLGGPFLEDLRIMAHFFPEMQLVSLESDEHTFRRQKFHQFDRRLDLRKRTLNDFLVHDYEPGLRDIFWLDYTGLEYKHFDELKVVLMKVPPGSVVRITLRAEPEVDLESLKDYLDESSINRIRDKVQADFKVKFKKVLPHPSAGPFASRAEFARMVQLMVKRAASSALDIAGSERDFLHAQSTRYNDNTQMLSVTGVVYNRQDLEATRNQLQQVRFVDFDWALPREINVPALSVKERMHLEGWLPISPGEDAGEILSSKMEYRIDNSNTWSKVQLANYAEYHRDYPYFVRISI